MFSNLILSSSQSKHLYISLTQFEIMAPEPYTISVPQFKINALKTKLSLTEFPDELADSKWDLGAPLADVKRLAKAWEQWDWRQAEEKLNKVPQYHTGIKVDGYEELDIHFIWQKSEVKNAIPLLFVHGCASLSPYPDLQSL